MPTASLTRLQSAGDAVAWMRARGVTGLATDSRAVRAGDAFIAWPGHAQDGRRHVGAAQAAGAFACLVEADGAEAWPFEGEVASVPGLKALSGEIASAWYGEPSATLRVVAITGTNGKTSTAWWLAQALAALGQRCGVVGTLGVGEPGALVTTGLTTPDPVLLQRTFRAFVDAGHTACAIEASSIGLVEHRLAGTRIAVAAFTNFTQDHLDFHGTMDAYWQAKAHLFAWPGLQAAVVNVDDARGAALAAEWRAPAALRTCGVAQPADLQARQLRYADGGLAFDVCEGAECAPVATTLIGDYNVANVLTVIGVLRALGVTLADAARACSQLGPVPGRMQRVDVAPGTAALPEVVVDYAHTPDALEKALRALAPLATARGGRLWCVFGCGGDRDAGKRPLMGAIAAAHAAHAVVTSDNPRSEAPEAITAQIAAGVPAGDAARVAVITDRHAAIAHAVSHAAAADVVLIAGKGHEDYQEAHGVRHAFVDADEARTALCARAASEAAPC